MFMSKSMATVDDVVVMALDVATDAARSAGENLLEFLRGESYWTRSKKDTSLQTAADTAAEEVIISKIQGTSPALDWCLVASGKADFVVTFADGSPDADASAGMFILEEAGGKITDFSGQPYSTENRGQIIGSNMTDLHKAVLQLIEEVNSHDCDGNIFD
jgi:fructose-1,6-bisphosphatase/inositol monophosphatase family enzyme